MRLNAISKLTVAAALGLAFMVSPLRITAQGGDTVLKPADTQKLLPARNSGGVKFADGYYLLATMIDTSGYSSDVAAKYQAYFVTEVPIKLGSHSLPAGVYGIGFIPGNKFVVTDVGAHDVLTLTSATDDAIKRPMPLQVLADPAGGFRLYEGRRYVHFSR
jgi:hypothetical protein